MNRRAFLQSSALFATSGALHLRANDPGGKGTAATNAESAAQSAFDEFERYDLGYVSAGSQLKDHIYERSRRAYATGDAARDALQTIDAVRARQAAIRRDLLASLGGLPASDQPPNARVVETIEGAGFAIEKLIFESRPRHYVTANLYLPARRAGRTPAVLFLCGHHDAAKQVEEYQMVCQTLVHAGLIVLAQDPIGQGERLSYYDRALGRATIAAGVPEHNHAGAPCRLLGDALGRYFLHDAMRSIDYLLTRPEVDAARIGVTGNSGGGTQTSLLMMADPRIAAAAPATFIMTRDSYQRTGQAQDAEQVWPGFTARGYDHEDILLAFAPKPVCVLAVTADFFPIEGTRQSVTRSRRIWELFQRGGALELVEDESVHRYTPKLAQAAAQFFAQHLLGRTMDFAGWQPATFPPEQLACTKSGQVSGDFADAEAVFESSAARAAQAEKTRRAASDQRQRAREWLQAEVFRAREAVDLNPRWIERGKRAGPFEVDVAFWWTQPGLANLGLLVRRPGASAKEKMPVTLAFWDDGTRALTRHAAWIETETARGRAVFVVNLCGVGPLQPDPINLYSFHEFYGTMHKLADDLDWLGDSLVALRTFEALRAMEALKVWPELATSGFHFYGHGRMGVHARLAALLDERIAGHEWREPFRFGELVTRRDYAAKGVKSFILPGVLQVFDVDEIA